MASAPAVPILELRAPKTPIPTCSPNLMPFHIQYSGPAPISTYFRVKTAPVSNHLANASNDTSSGDVADSQLSLEGTSDSQATLVSQASTSFSSGSASTYAGNVGAQAISGEDEGEGLVAAFRGRTVRGAKIDLPEGFAGVVLDDAQSKHAAPVSTAQDSQRSARPSRVPSKKRGVVAVEDADEGDVAMDDPTGPVRTLQATGTFSSFVLWNPDIPMDEGRDEYLRSLMEWTKIAAEVSPSISCVCSFIDFDFSTDTSSRGLNALPRIAH